MTVAEFVNKIGFKVKDKDVKDVNNTISNIKSTATKLLGAIGIGFSLTQLNAITEEFTQIKTQISNATSELGNQAEIQQKILDAASATRSEYSDTANMVSKLVKENSELFGTVDEAIAFNNAATMLFKTAGKTNEDIAGLMEAINKSFAKGRVDSETISQLLEKSPEAVELLNKKLGTTSDQLEQMVSDGKISVQDLRDAFVDNADTIASSFGNVKMTVTDALTVIRNKWGLWLADTNEMLELTSTIANTMVKGFDAIMRGLTKVRNGVVWLSEKLGGAKNLLRLITIAAGAIGAVYVIKNMGKITDFLGGVGEKLSFINAKNLMLVAGIVLLALLVEDFINFMQGNDSLIGTLLENAGVDVDKFRENVVKIWENIKTVLGAVWRGIKNVAIPLFQGIWEAIKTVFEKIGEIIEKVAPSVADFVDRLANGDVDTEEWEALGEAIAAIAAIIAGVIVVMKVFAAVQAIVNAVMTASPITWIILAIIALIAIIVLLVKNWDKVKAVFLKAWEAIKGAWGKVVDFFKGIWDGIVGVFSSVVSWFGDLFTSAWDAIKGAFASVVEWFSGIFSSAWEAIKGVFSTVGEFFSGVWETIVGLFTTIGTAVGDAISGAVKGAINAVLSGAITIINGFISAINFAIGIINKIPGVNISELKKLEVPQLAEGGYVKANKPQPVIIGDNKREGEIVSPISKMRATVLDALSLFASSAKVSAPTAAVASGNGGISKSIVQNVEINNEFNGDKAIQQKAATAMDKSATDVTAELARGLAYAR